MIYFRTKLCFCLSVNQHNRLNTTSKSNCLNIIFFSLFKKNIIHQIKLKRVLHTHSKNILRGFFAKPITFNSYMPHSPNTHVSSAIKFRDNTPHIHKIFRYFSVYSKNMFHSHLIETTFYVNASLKLYCLAIIFIGFCIWAFLSALFHPFRLSFFFKKNAIFSFSW